MYILNIILIILHQALEIATRVVPGVNGKCLNECDLRVWQQVERTLLPHFVRLLTY